MGARGKAEAVRGWALTWPQLGGYLKLNAILAEDGAASVNVVPNDAVRTAYIDGTADREYTFQLKIILPWSEGYDGVNAEADALVSSWLDWVSSQFGEGNLPDWPGADITAIAPTQNAPGLNFVYQDEGLAEYVFEAVVEYTE